MTEIKLYFDSSQNDCPDCYLVTNLLKNNKVDYIPLDIDGNEANLEYVLNTTNGYRSVPIVRVPIEPGLVIDFDEREEQLSFEPPEVILIEPNKIALEEVLRIAGYIRSN